MLADDVIIVASDGIETLDLVQLQNFMLRLRPSGAQGIADCLIRAVDGIGKTRSYQDNTTIVVVAASEGAGMTRVARPAVQVTAAEPAGRGWTLARMLSFLGAFSRKTATVIGGVVIVLLLLWVFVIDRRGPPPPDGKTLKSMEAPGPKDPKRPANAITATPGDSRPDQVAGQQTEIGQQHATVVPAPETSSNGPNEAGPSAQNDSSERPVYGQIRLSRNNYAFQGGRLRSAEPGVDGGKCNRACLDANWCVAFTWHADNLCELFSTLGKLTPEPGALSGWDKIR
jgi:hypothetical protein